MTKLRHWVRQIAMLPEDLDELMVRLKAAFGENARILPYDYWRRGPELREEDEGLPEPRIDYLDRLWEPESRGVREMRVWWEPEGWRPQWQGPDEDGKWLLLSPPARQITHVLPPHIRQFRGETLYSGSVAIQFDAEDAAERSFVGRVFRIIDKMTIDEFDMVDSIGDWRPHHRGKTGCRTGPAAIRWLEAAPHRTINENMRPYNPDVPLKVYGSDLSGGG